MGIMIGSLGKKYLKLATQKDTFTFADVEHFGKGGRYTISALVDNGLLTRKQVNVYKEVDGKKRYSHRYLEFSLATKLSDILSKRQLAAIQETQI